MVGRTRAVLKTLHHRPHSPSFRRTHVRHVRPNLEETQGTHHGRASAHRATALARRARRPRPRTGPRVGIFFPTAGRESRAGDRRARSPRARRRRRPSPSARGVIVPTIARVRIDAGSLAPRPPARERPSPVADACFRVSRTKKNSPPTGSDPLPAPRPRRPRAHSSSPTACSTPSSTRCSCASSRRMATRASRCASRRCARRSSFARRARRTCSARRADASAS